MRKAKGTTDATVGTGTPLTKVRKAAVGLGCFVLLIIAATMFFFSRSQWIDAGHVGIVYNANGGLDRSHVRPPERVFVGWGQRLYQYPTMLQNAIYTQDPKEGDEKAAVRGIVAQDCASQRSCRWCRSDGSGEQPRRSRCGCCWHRLA